MMRDKVWIVIGLIDWLVIVTFIIWALIHVHVVISVSR
jgi:hypothetical protein